VKRQWRSFIYLTFSNTLRQLSTHYRVKKLKKQAFFVFCITFWDIWSLIYYLQGKYLGMKPRAQFVNEIRQVFSLPGEEIQLIKALEVR